MRVTLLDKNPKVYSCNVYHIRGNWNALDDVNTLIDAGTNGSVLSQLEKISSGIGKSCVEQVILTHEHFDHAGGLMAIKEAYSPVVYALSMFPGVDKKIHDGMDLKIGDREAIIFLTPGHSNDSVCIYCEEEAAIFAGDTPLNIRTSGGSYSKQFVGVLEKFVKLDIKTIYSGHDEPITHNADKIIKLTLSNVLKSKII